MIPQQNLSRLSNRLARNGGQRITEAVLERDYCLAWFLVAYSRTPLSKRLAFKGGTALKRCYFGDYRFSEDLDFTLLKETGVEVIRKELDLVFSEARKAANVVLRFAHLDSDSHENSHTFYVGYEGPLPATSRGKEVKVDITIREKLVFPLAKKPVLRGYEEYADLPEKALVQVYSLDEIAVEKISALADSARNEPRDLYDLWYLIAGNHVEPEVLVDPLKQKLSFRGKALADVGKNFLSKEKRYEKLWSIRLAAQMAELPEFEDVYRIVKRALRQAGLLTGKS